MLFYKQNTIQGERCCSSGMKCCCYPPLLVTQKAFFCNTEPVLLVSSSLDGLIKQFVKPTMEGKSLLFSVAV